MLDGPGVCFGVIKCSRPIRRPWLHSTVAQSTLLTGNVILCVFYCTKNPQWCKPMVHCCWVSHGPRWASGSFSSGCCWLTYLLDTTATDQELTLNHQDGLPGFIKWNHPVKTKSPFGLHICTNTEPCLKLPDVSGQRTAPLCLLMINSNYPGQIKLGQAAPIT